MEVTEADRETLKLSSGWLIQDYLDKAEAIIIKSRYQEITLRLPFGFEF